MLACCQLCDLPVQIVICGLPSEAVPCPGGEIVLGEPIVRVLVSLIFASLVLTGCASSSLTDEERAQRAEERRVEREQRAGDICTGRRLCR